MTGTSPSIFLSTTKMKQPLRFTIAGYIVFLILTVWGAVPTSAQSLLSMEDYSNRLSEHMVTDIQQDERGFLYFSTWNGMHRFDGYTFKNYKTYPGEECVMVSNRLLLIRINRSGKIWCLDYDRNAYLFDPETERFSELKMQEPVGLIGNIICAADSTSYLIAEDRILIIDERRLDLKRGIGVTEIPFGDSKLGSGRRIVDVVYPEGSSSWIVTDQSLISGESCITLPEEGNVALLGRHNQFLGIVQTIFKINHRPEIGMIGYGIDGRLQRHEVARTVQSHRRLETNLLRGGSEAEAARKCQHQQDQSFHTRFV